MSVDQARKRLDVQNDVERIVIRRQVGARIVWFAFSHSEIERLLRAEPAEQRLDETKSFLWTMRKPAKTITVDSGRNQLVGFTGLLMDGERPVGWLEAPPSAIEVSGSETQPHSDDGSVFFRVRYVTEAARDRVAGLARRLHEMLSTVRHPSAEEGDIFSASDGEFQAYPRIDAPDTVTARAELTVTVGVASAPVAGVDGAPLTLSGLPAGTEAVMMDVHLLADGFDILDEAGERGRLSVELANPGQESVTYRLIAPALESGEHARVTLLRVQYAYRGVPCGFAYRRITVRRASPLTFGRTKNQTSTASTPLGPSEDAPVPDLTVSLFHVDGNYARGNFRWSFESPHALDLPSGSLHAWLGEGRDAATFARWLVSRIERDDGRALIHQHVKGIGQEIRKRMPEEFWTALDQVAEAARAQGRPLPTLLLLSEEQYIPWELAYMESPLDPQRPPFLGAQVSVARWILGTGGMPRLPPPHEVQVRTIAVVTGNYDQTRKYEALPHAIQEGNELRDKYGALPVAMNADDINRLLDGDLHRAGDSVSPELVHFACHGEWNADNPAFDRLVLESGDSLDAFAFAGAELGRKSRPVIFLNACEVGNAQQILGGYGGFAGLCLGNHFRGFVAPLWKVKDDLAQNVAFRFYERALGNGTHCGIPVADALRDIRSEYDGSVQPTYTTPLAYIFYGHPCLVLTIETVRAGNN